MVQLTFGVVGGMVPLAALEQAVVVVVVAVVLEPDHVETIRC